MANAVSDLASIKPLEEALSQKRQARESAFKPMQESLTAKGEIEAAQKKQTAEATAEMEKSITGEQERYAQRAAEAPQRGEMAKVAEGLERPFIPTQDNMRDMAGLFSLINVVGFAMGRGGKQNAVQAMNAMNGMLEGYQQGREDLYKKEKGQFELNLKRLKQQMDTLDKQLKDALQTYATDRDAGIQKARAAFAQAGADFYKQYEEKYGLAATYEYHKQIYAAAEKAEQTALREYERAREKADAERRHRESMAQRERQHREALESREKLASLKGVGGRSAINERYANTVYRSANETLRSLELIEQIGVTVGGGPLGSVVGKGSIPSEVQRYIGQALTDEQQKNYNTAMSGVALELAYVLNGGYKPDVSTVNKLETYLAVGPNDTPGTAAYKFADVAAKLKAAIEVSPTYTDQQQKIKDSLFEKLDRYATPEIVYERAYGVPQRMEPTVRSGEYPRPQTQEEFDALPPDTQYIDPDDGKIYIKRKK